MHVQKVQACAEGAGNPMLTFTSARDPLAGALMNVFSGLVPKRTAHGMPTFSAHGEGRAQSEPVNSSCSGYAWQHTLM